MKVTLAALAAAIATPALADDISIVHAGKLLAVPGEPAQAERTIIVRNGKIEKIAAGYLDAATAGAAADVTKNPPDSRQSN